MKDNEVDRAGRAGIFREINDRLRELGGSFSFISEDDEILFVCECDDLGCLRSVRAAAEEYDRIRSLDGHCLVVPAHARPADRVTVITDRYAVVGLSSDEEEGRRGELACVECGYGVAAWPAPTRCPMCHGSEWTTTRPPRLAAA